MKPIILALVSAVCAAGAFPLDSMLARGDSCLAVVWTPDSQNTKPDWYVQWGTLCTGSDSIYRRCDFTPGVTYTGICYSYGGEDSYAVFREKVSRGFLVGSHLCHYNSFKDPSSVIAGTDCSGFVCYVWNVPRVATGTLATKYTAIQKSELRAGDILVKAGIHTVFVVEAIDQTHFLIWESTSAVNGCRERTIDITAAEWSPYAARRNTVSSAGKSNNLPAPGRAAFTVRAAADGRMIFITALPSSRGPIEILTLRGHALLNIPIAETNAGTVTLRMNSPLAAGTYLAKLGPAQSEQPVVFIVSKR